ncbi:MAG: hypothetical protein AAF280_05805 [Pseudomonadota bacterium]
MSLVNQNDPLDPKGLIREAYLIDGITWEECRSIFLDWALSLPDGQDARSAIDAMMERHAQVGDGHPMTDVLVEGQQASARPKRRGGWRSRDR